MTYKLKVTYRYSVPAPGGTAPSTPPGAPAEGESAWLSRLGRLWLWLALAAGAVSVWAHFQIGLNNDHLSLFEDTRRILAGGRSNVDYVDVNPPLISYLYALPLLLSHATGMALQPTFYAFTFAVIAMAFFLVSGVLRHSKVTAVTQRAALGALALALLTASFVHQPLADRDHLMMVLAAPWFVLYSPLVRGEIPLRWRLAAAAFAAIGFAIKPYFYLFYLATVAFQLFSGRRLRDLLRQSEHYVVCGFALSYAAFVVVFHSAYVRETLLIGWLTYDALGWSWDQKMQVVWNELLGGYAVPGLLATVALVIVEPRLYHRSLTYLYVLLTACAASYLVNAGWYYTQYPFIAVALLLAVDAGGRLCQFAAQGRSPIGLLIVVILLGGVLGHFFAQPVLFRARADMYVQRERGHPWSTIEMHPVPAQKIEAQLAARPRFILLSTNFWATNLLKEGSPRLNAGRFNFLWPLPGTLRYEQADPKTYRRLASWLAESIADDLERRKPDLVIVDASFQQRSLPARFRILDWLSRSERFARAWDTYSLGESITACDAGTQANCAYELYYRKAGRAD